MASWLCREGEAQRRAAGWERMAKGEKRAVMERGSATILLASANFYWRVSSVAIGECRQLPSLGVEDRLPAHISGLDSSSVPISTTQPSTRLTRLPRAHEHGLRYRDRGVNYSVETKPMIP